MEAQIYILGRLDAISDSQKDSLHALHKIEEQNDRIIDLLSTPGTSRDIRHQSFNPFSKSNFINGGSWLVAILIITALAKGQDPMTLLSVVQSILLK